MSSLDMFLNEIQKYPLLSAQEELSLGKQMMEGDKIAREALINHNLRLVISCAKKYQDRGVEMSDLVSAGYEGLITAVDKYDYRRGLRFSTNAVYWIQNSLNRYITNCGRSIRYPVHIWEKINRMRKFQTEYLSAYGEEPSINIISSELNMSVKDVKKYLEYATSQIISLNESYDEDDNTLEDIIEDESSENIDSGIEKESLYSTLKGVLNTLTEQEKEVIIFRYGLFGKSSLTLEELGRKWGVSRERIRQIEIKAMLKMRHPARSVVLKEFLK